MIVTAKETWKLPEADHERSVGDIGSWDESSSFQIPTPH